MRKDDAIVNLPRTQFYINDPKLDTIALKIVWERDQRLWKNFVVEKYPIFGSIQRWDSRKIRKLLEQIYLDNQSELLRAQRNFRNWWSTVEDRWYLFLTDLFELKMRKGISFKACIGIAPIFPRDIKNESFLVPLCANHQEVLIICAHEISHFFFYRKIKEASFALQPDKRRLWVISELLVPLLFGDHQAISILGQMPQDSYICKETLIERCWRIYQERLEGKISGAELIGRLLQVEIKDEELNTKFFG
jgi:hypothetical protein